MSSDNILRGQTFYQALHDKYLVEDTSYCPVNIVVITPKRKNQNQAKLGHLLTVVLNEKNIVSAGLSHHCLTEMCPNVVDLDLSFNKFEKWSEVSSILHHLPKLKYVSLNGNPLHIDLGNEIQSRNDDLMIETLALSHTSVSINEATTLSDLLPCLKELQLCGNSYEHLADIEDKIDEGAFSTLECLRLNNNKIERWSEVWKLRKLPNLKSLILSDNPISNVFYTKDMTDDKETMHPHDDNEPVFSKPGGETTLTSHVDCDTTFTKDELSKTLSALAPLDRDDNCNQQQISPQQITDSILNDVIDKVILPHCLSSSLNVGNCETISSTSTEDHKHTSKDVVYMSDDLNQQDGCECDISQVNLEFGRENRGLSVQDNANMPSNGDESGILLGGIAVTNNNSLREKCDVVYPGDAAITLSEPVQVAQGSSSDVCVTGSHDTQTCNTNTNTQTLQADWEGTKERTLTLVMNQDKDPLPDAGDDDDRNNNKSDGVSPTGCAFPHGTSTCTLPSSSSYRKHSNQSFSVPGLTSFNNLESLCISNCQISQDEDLSMLSYYPKLCNLRIQHSKLYAGIDQENRRKLFIASLPNISHLNGSEISSSEREKAERHFLRHFMKDQRKPNSYDRLIEKHGPPVELVDIDLTAGLQEWATLKFVYQGQVKFTEKVRLFDQVRKLRHIIARNLRLPSKEFTMHFNPCNPIHPVWERDLTELRCESLPMSRLDFADSDEIHVDIPFIESVQ